jgi:hypothetical protein
VLKFQAIITSNVDGLANDSPYCIVVCVTSSCFTFRIDRSFVRYVLLTTIIYYDATFRSFIWLKSAYSSSFGHVVFVFSVNDTLLIYCTIISTRIVLWWFSFVTIIVIINFSSFVRYSDRFGFSVLNVRTTCYVDSIISITHHHWKWRAGICMMGTLMWFLITRGCAGKLLKPTCQKRPDNRYSLTMADAHTCDYCPAITNPRPYQETYRLKAKSALCNE